MQTTNLTTDTVLTALERGELYDLVLDDADGRRAAVLMRGCSGSGKSTFWRNVFDRSTNVCFSADDYFNDINGNYCFDGAKLPHAHRWCLRSFCNEARDGSAHVLGCDNTNTSVAELAPYAAVAQAYGLAVYIFELHRNPREARAANVHDVPLKSIHRQIGRMQRSERFLPPWWPVFKIPHRDI